MNIDEMIEKKKIVMKECNHLFVKQKEGEWDGLCHSSDAFYIPAQVCCLKCGLNNRFLLFKDRRKYDYDTYLALSIFPQFRLNDLNDEVFEETFKFGWRDKCAAFGEDKVFNLISKEVINCDNPQELYLKVKELLPNGNNEEIFNKMKELNKEKVKKLGGKYD